MESPTEEGGIMHSAFMIGSLQRRAGPFFIYKVANSTGLKNPYALYRAPCAASNHLGMLPRTLNIWQPQLLIWLLAKYGSNS
jgi:hypothetical protein